MISQLNYRHLRYFWVTAREGSFTLAAERLGVAVQTVSAQIALLEASLGASLLVQQGRRLVPTEAGRIALSYADQIFPLGDRLVESLRDTSREPVLRLSVGIVDALPKLIAHRFLSGATAPAELEQPVRLICEEGDFDDLVADLALHRFDVVLADRPASASANLRVYNHPLTTCEITLFGIPALVRACRKHFPASLVALPLLLPTRGNTLRGRLDQWFAAHEIQPKVAGEFEDSALMMTFGKRGLGLFPAPSLLGEDIAAQYGAVAAGELTGVREEFYAITAERRIRHPAVEAILKSAG